MNSLPPRSFHAALGPITIAALLVLLAWLFTSGRSPAPRFAPPGAVSAPVIEQNQPALALPLSGRYTSRSTQRLLVMSVDDLLSEQEEARLAADLERALDYVIVRFGSSPHGTISTYLGHEPTCGLHGIAYTSMRTVQVFTCRELPLSRAISIAAHEFVHQLSHDRYGKAHLQADLVLMEGIATWGAGSYWLGHAPDFRTFVRPWLERNEALPLATSYVGRPISDMNKLYYQWASFVEFLIERDGRERFDLLYTTGSGAPGSADYRRLYQRTFAELEAEWKAWVLRP